MSNLIINKTTSAIFLTIVLIAGTFAAISPSFITGVNAEPYYGMDKDRKSDKKDVSVQSLKCNNINVNVNGLELSVLPPFLGGEVAAEAEDGTTDANSLANDGANDGSTINDFGFICINNNNNTVIQDEIPLTPPKHEPEPKSTLTVKKLLSCQSENENFCIGFGLTHRPSDFSFQVTGNNPQPSTFTGSETDLFQSQNNVTIGPGPYTITETIPEIETGFNLTTTFSGSCIADPAVPQKATGTIVAGTDQTCEIINTYTPRPLGVTGAQSSLTAQETADSPELTAQEKLTKLKTQWLNQLP